MLKVIRIETQEDLEFAFNIRKEVFVHEQNVPEEDELDKYESIAYHYLALWKDKPVGTARWRITNNGYKLERFAVLKDYRKNGIGKALMEQMMQDIQNHPASSKKNCYLHSQIPVVPFYQAFGFQKKGDQFDECGIMHFKMVRKAK